MPSNLPRPRILYVDDDEDSRDMLCTLLGTYGMETKAVGTASEALIAIHGEHFDLYLLDGWLPDLDGFELCRQMRNFDGQTPILFFSGAAYDGDKTLGYRAGANDYIVKPDVPDLIGSIRKFIPNVKHAVS